jgi:hypothetical protein
MKSSEILLESIMSSRGGPRNYGPLVTTKDLSKRLSFLFNAFAVVTLLGVFVIVGNTLWTVIANPAPGLQTQITQINNSLTQVNNSVTNLTNLIGSVNLTELLIFFNNFNTTEITNLDARVTDLEGDVTNLTTQVTILQGNVTNLDSRVTILEGNVTTLQGDITNLDARVSVLEGNVTSLQAQILNQQIDIAFLISNATAQQVQIDALTAVSNLLNITGEPEPWGSATPVTVNLLQPLTGFTPTSSVICQGENITIGGPPIMIWELGKLSVNFIQSAPGPINSATASFILNVAFDITLRLHFQFAFPIYINGNVTGTSMTLTCFPRGFSFPNEIVCSGDIPGSTSTNDVWIGEELISNI